MDNKMILKWQKEYIDNINIDNISYLNLTPNELRDFFFDNYLDTKEWTFVTDSINHSYRPIGLLYLNYDNFDEKNKYEINKRYLIGVVNNNKGKKTIVSCIKYCFDYDFYENQVIHLNYFMTVEVNKYFRGKGLCKDIIKEYTKYIDYNNPLIITLESEMGKLCSTHNIITNNLRENGYEQDIRSIADCSQEYINMLTNTFKLKK